MLIMLNRVIDSSKFFKKPVFGFFEKLKFNINRFRFFNNNRLTGFFFGKILKRLEIIRKKVLFVKKKTVQWKSEEK